MNVTGTTLLDCDGVCCSFDVPIVKAVNPSLTVEDIRELNDWDIFKLFNEEEMKMCDKILEDPLFWENLPVIEATQKAVEKVRKLDGQVVFVTSPWESCKEWDYTRRQYLKKHFGAKGRDDIIITSAKHHVYGDMLIDDRLSNVEAWQNKWKTWGKTGILFESNTNFKCDFYPRIVIKDGNWKIKENKENE